MKNLLFVLGIMAFLVVTGCEPQKKTEKEKPRYAPDYASLSKHNQQPEWFQYAK
jgi:hypothetical protein